VDSVATATPTSSFELSGRGVISGSNQLPQIAGLQEYTASLKGAAIVSSSQQITNYYKFAETASVNTFYGNQTFLGTVDMATASIANASFVESATHFDIDTVGGKKLRLNKSGNQLIMGTAAPVLIGSVTEDGTSNPLQVNGNQSITGGDLVFRTAGKGIDFSATSNGSGTTTSELLNDYEEGTFTPVLKGSTTDGTYTYDTDRTSGKYVKIGKQVFLEGVLRVSAVTSAGSGNALVSGIPFAPAEIAASWDRVPGVLHVQSGPTLPSASLFCYTQGNTYTDSIGFAYDGMDGWNQLPVTTVDEVDAMWFFSITYIVS
jgi:hypothetical protein